MRFILGVTVVVLGVVLVMHGLGAYDSAASGVSRLVTGMPADKTLWLLAGGVLAILLGMSITARKPPKRPVGQS